MNKYCSFINTCLHLKSITFFREYLWIVMVMPFMQVSGKDISVVSSPKENHPSENIFTVTVTTTPSNCPNNGTATVTTSEPGVYVYDIISGPPGVPFPNRLNHWNLTGLCRADYVD